LVNEEVTVGVGGLGVLVRVRVAEGVGVKLDVTVAMITGVSETTKMMNCVAGTLVNT
jgi:hypothetical protein